MNSSPPLLSDLHKARTLYRRQLKEVIIAGDLDGLNAQLKRQWPKPGWVTTSLVCNAAKQPHRDILRKVAQGANEKTLKDAGRALFKGRDAWGLVGIAEVAKAMGKAPVVGRDMLNLVAASHEVGLMRGLVDALDGCDQFPEMMENAVLRAADHQEWDMYRYLTVAVPIEDVVKQAPDFLYDMVRWAATPRDLVEQALEWTGPDDGVLRGELLVHAAGCGRTEFMALLMEKGTVTGQKVAQAVLDALKCDHPEAVGWLVPHATVQDLSTEFSWRMAEAAQRPNAAILLGALRENLDQVGGYLDFDGLKAWAHCFSHESIPLTKARLREVRAVSVEMPPETQGTARRARLRA